MAFSRGVMAREQEGKHFRAVEEATAAWLQAHRYRPPWITPPVTLIAIFRNGRKVMLDLEYHGTDDQGRHKLRAAIPPKAFKLRVTSHMKIRYEGGDDHDHRQPEENVSAQR